MPDKQIDGRMIQRMHERTEKASYRYVEVSRQGRTHNSTSPLPCAGAVMEVRSPFSEKMLIDRQTDGQTNQPTN